MCLLDSMICLFVGFVQCSVGLFCWLFVVLVVLVCLFVYRFPLELQGDQADQLLVCPGLPDLGLHYSPWVKTRAFGFGFLNLELQL